MNIILTPIILLLSLPSWKLICSAVILTFLSSALWQVYFSLRPDRPPLVFHWIPWFGNFLQYKRNPYQFIHDCSRRKGEIFSFVMLGKLMTVYVGYEGNEFFFNASSDYLSAKECYKKITVPVFGKGVVYDSSTEKFMQQKKFVKNALSVEALRSYVPLIKKEVMNYFETSKHFKKQSGPAGSFNPLVTQSEMIFCTAARTLLGQELRSKLNTSYSSLYGDLDRGFSPINLIFQHLPLEHYARRDRAQATISDAHLSVIRQRKTKKDLCENDLMNRLVENSQYNDGTSMTDREIANLLIAVMMGGQHSSVTTSTWCLLHLADDQELQQNLYDEVNTVLDNGKTPLTYELLNKMTLLQQTLQETLRLHHPLHSLLRKVIKDISIPCTSYVIPKNSFVLISPGFMHMQSEYFKNASKFDVNRWNSIDLNEEADQVDYGFGSVSRKSKTSYLPFGAGRHRCIGERYAFCQLGVVVVTLLQTMKWKFEAGTKLPETDYNSMIALPAESVSLLWEKRI